MDTRTWTDVDLIRAVEESTTWMGVIRSLGLRSSSSVDTARKHARRLGLDTSHIHGQIKYAWTATALTRAIEVASDWEMVTDSLGVEDTALSGPRYAVMPREPGSTSLILTQHREPRRPTPIGFGSLGLDRISDWLRHR